MSGTRGVLRKALLVLGLSAVLVVPGGSAMANTADSAPGGVPFAGAQLVDARVVSTNSAAAAIYEVTCIDNTKREVVIFFRPNVSCSFDVEYGFAALKTWSSRSHDIKVCTQTNLPFTEEVNPANPDGSATGQIIPYVDQPGGGCYERNGVGYPIRKFRAVWNGITSAWIAPY